MKLKQIVAWTAIILFCISPLFLLFWFGPKGNFDFSTITHKIGQSSGLIGLNLFAVSFILSTRARFIEEMFDGLDKVYGVHAIVGGLALVMLLMHPIFLVMKFIPMNLDLAAKYLIPGGYLSVDLGIYALAGMIFLLCLTFFANIKYQMWKFSHEFFGLVFIVAAFHVFLVRDSVAMDDIFSGYYVYATIITFIGLSSFIYSLVIRRITNRSIYKISLAKKHGSEVFEISLLPTGKPMRYKSGQFIFVTFYRIGKEQHPFSIASRSNNEEIKIVIKNLGDYTSRLGSLEIGDTVLIEGPYGRFHYKESGSGQIWLAGGIGITPFIGMAEDLLSLKDGSKVDLYYSVKKKDEFVDLEFFRHIQAKNPNFRLFTKVSDIEGYLNITDVLAHSGSLKKLDFFLCGPEGFKSSLTKGLLSEGVQKERINSEDFNFR